MRTVLAGNGVNTTATVNAWLSVHNELYLADLILIGEEKHPNALWLTNWASPLTYSLYGKFNPAAVTREKVSSKIGLAAEAMKITWTPKSSQIFTKNTLTDSPFDLAQHGFYDNWRLRIFRTFMPTPGDANTWGAAVWFGGFVSTVEIDRDKLVFNANDYRYALNYQVPANVVEVTNQFAHYVGTKPPKGFSRIPQFAVASPSSTTSILGDTLPLAGFTAHHIFGNGDFNNPMAWLIFNSGPGATLAGLGGPIGQNFKFNDFALSFNDFILYNPLPWAPTPYNFSLGTGDTFYVSAAPTVSQADAAGFGDPYGGFPFVPYPSSIP
jgi:hypothetical protein